ncbi:MAG TPA: glycosyltransferase WbuB, partial [Balneolaceae bacterium]|nr:glycosyltransferase WbuB [Balneolaceae bacterium]
LLGVEGQAKKIIEKYKAGLCYEPENKEDFIHQLKTLKEDSVLYETISANGAKLARAFDRDKLAKEMFDFLVSSK